MRRDLLAGRAFLHGSFLVFQKTPAGDKLREIVSDGEQPERERKRSARESEKRKFRAVFDTIQHKFQLMLILRREKSGWRRGALCVNIF